MKDPFRHAAPLGHGRHLHLGCGPHLLPRPWENFDAEVDLRKPLPFPDRCALFIMAEHVIEHVPFVAGMAFLKQCYRVLEPGGVLRLAFPDVTNFYEETDGSGRIDLYLDFLRGLGAPHQGLTDIYEFILTNSGHQSAWTNDLGFAALEVAGFREIYAGEYGRSPHNPLDGIDGHHLTSSLTAATLETTVIEATK